MLKRVATLLKYDIFIQSTLKYKCFFIKHLLGKGQGCIFKFLKISFIIFYGAFPDFLLEIDNRNIVCLVGISISRKKFSFLKAIRFLWPPYRREVPYLSKVWQSSILFWMIYDVPRAMVLYLPKNIWSLEIHQTLY